MYARMQKRNAHVQTQVKSTVQLDLSNYCMFTNLLSFLGIEEAALVIEVKIRFSLDLCVCLERLHPRPFN